MMLQVLILLATLPLLHASPLPIPSLDQDDYQLPSKCFTIIGNGNGHQASTDCQLEETQLFLCLSKFPKGMLEMTKQFSLADVEEVNEKFQNCVGKPECFGAKKKLGLVTMKVEVLREISKAGECFQEATLLDSLTTCHKSTSKNLDEMITCSTEKLRDQATCSKDREELDKIMGNLVTSWMKMKKEEAELEKLTSRK